jgi:RNA polymerase sigma-70 factor, ECF subfamily
MKPLGAANRMIDDPVAPLLAKVAAQDRQAFRDLYSNTSSKLFGVLLRILTNRAEAEDALQEVFTRVWLRAGRYDPEKGRAMTWLIAIARNHAIDRLRTRAEPTTASGDETDTLIDHRPGVEAGLVAKGQARLIIDCMAALEPDRALAVQGAYLSGQSYADLSARFNVPLNTMRTWLRRSLLQLKECLEK